MKKKALFNIPATFICVAYQTCHSWSEDPFSNVVFSFRWPDHEDEKVEKGRYANGPVGGGKDLDYDEVFAQSSPTNCTVYVGGCTSGDENALRRAFGNFGRIMKVRYFKDWGYAFVRYDNKESACKAIVALHLTAVGGQVLKCNWKGGGR